MTEPTTAAGPRTERMPVRIKVYGGSLSLLPPGTAWRVERTTEHVAPIGAIGEPMTEWTIIDLVHIEAEARQQDGSALREALERLIEEYGDDALGIRFTVNDIVEWLAALPPSAPQEPAREDEPEPTHPWDGMADGHNCASCGPESIWKCDRPAHPPRPAGRVMPTRAEYAVEAERIVDDLVLPPSAPPALDDDLPMGTLASRAGGSDD